MKSKALVQIKHIHRVLSLNEADVGVPVQLFNHNASSLNLLNGNQTASKLLSCLTNHSTCLCFSRFRNDLSFRQLILLLHDKLGSLSILLRDLLCLDGRTELLGKVQVSNRDVIQNQTEVLSSGLQLLPNICGHLLSECNQLLGIVICNNCLEDLISDRWQHLFVVILTNIVEDHW